jgi:hypothetical protein
MLSTEWAGASSQDHRATVLLRDEHATLLELFRRQHQAVEPGVTQDVLQEQIVEHLAFIGRIEREVFFPALPSQYAPLVRACTAAYDDLATCAAGVRAPTASVALHNAHGERLELMTRDHLAAEQSLLFAAIERDQPDLNRTLYDQLVATRPALCDRRPS